MTAVATDNTNFASSETLIISCSDGPLLDISAALAAMAKQLGFTEENASK